MLSIRFGVGLLGAVLGFAAIAAPAATPQNRDQVYEMAATMAVPAARLGWLLELGWSGAPVAAEARATARDMALAFDPRMFVSVSRPMLASLPPEGQADILRVYDSLYSRMTGYNIEMNAAIGEATASPDREVRRVATEIVARWKLGVAYFNLRRRANRSTGEDRIEAIRAIGALEDPRAAYFLPTLLDSKDPDVVRATYESLGRTGRAATHVLKERLSHPSREQRLLALETLMPQAVVDDLTALYAFLQANPDLEEDLAGRLRELIVRLEIVRDTGVETPRQ